MQFVLDFLNKTHCQSDCSCESCRKRKLVYGTFNCSICGYSGPPATLQCTCYETMCHSEHNSSSCPHGSYVCPACDDGEADGWAIIKELRNAIKLEQLIQTVPKKEHRYIVTGEAVVDVGPCETEDDRY